MKASASALRRSCNFCRARKIRCSGQPICGACSERNIDCMYVREASKGRPRRSLSKNSSRAQPRYDDDPTRSKSLLPAVQSSASSSSFVSNDDPFERRYSTPSRLDMASDESSDTLASELTDMFDEDFRHATLTKSNAFQESLAAFHRKVSHNPTSTLESLLGAAVEDTPRRSISYAQLLYTVTQGLVEMLAVRFGNLGCYQLKDSNARFYAVSLANDDTPTMFEADVAEEVNPLDTFDRHRTVQMIEVWFSVHPLATIVSKTLFLRSYSSNTHDPLLLAVMLADASYVHEDDASRGHREALFRWTAARLCDRPATECGLSTVQMLMILGWHELCISHARRATCLLGYACRITTRLQARYVQTPETGLRQVNGIDIARVEEELVRNIYWLTFSITLWSFMQIDQPYPQLLPPTVPTEFPPMDESSSAVVQLDMASENVSTLAKQAEMIHELWPLSHVASTTAHIYALLPRGHDADEAACSESWQSQPHHQLRLLLSVKQNISVLCINIRKVLVNAVKVLEVKVENALSKALVLTAYHTTIVHLLFPRLDSPTDQTVVSEELLTDFCVSAQSLLELFSVVDAEHDTDHLITRIRSSTFADVFVLGLDVCSRAMEYFLTRLNCGSALEVENVNGSIANLMSIASIMHATSKSETLLTAKNLRLVKKKLKMVKLQLHSLGTPHGSGSSCSVEEQPSGSLTPLDALISGLPSFEPNAPLPDLWSRAAPMDLGSMPYDVFSAGGIHRFSQTGLMEDLDMYQFDNGDPITRHEHVSSEHIPGLENVGIDMDIACLGFIGVGNSGALAGRPSTGSN